MTAIQTAILLVKLRAKPIKQKPKLIIAKPQEQC